MHTLRVLAICGSLRRQSNNAILLRAAARLTTGDASLHLYSEAGALPLFNADLESGPPPTVHRLWNEVTIADALLIASPEYAHGVSGVIKNLLDWLVGLPAFCGKPVAVLNASPRAQHADAALREILRTMSAHVVDRASITLPILGSGIDEDGIVASAALASALRAALAALSEAARTRAAQMPAAPGDEAGSTGRR